MERLRVFSSLFSIVSYIEQSRENISKAMKILGEYDFIFSVWRAHGAIVNIILKGGCHVKLPRNF